MALTFTEVGLQTELQAVSTAVDAGDYPLARRKLVGAEAINATLATEAEQRGQRYKRPSVLDGLRVAIEGAESSESRASDALRILRTSFRF